MAARTKTFIYTANLVWEKGVEGVVSGPNRPDIRVSAPPEFKGPEGHWSPEHLYVAAVETCLMLTFLALARSRRLEVEAYSSRAEGLLEPVHGKLVISKVTVRPSITIRSADDREKAQGIVDRMEADCFISNSIDSEVVIEPEIVVSSK